VLRFDRRTAPTGGDVPIATQAADACVAVAALRAVDSGARSAPVGLWGWSQGAWAALVAASRLPDIAFLVLVGASGVSPAEQMRYGTAEQLRRSGFGGQDLAELADVRVAFKGALRGTIDRTELQTLIDGYAARPWFDLAYVPRVLPGKLQWTDMDFDPKAAFAKVRCPVLLFYGEQDEWVPIEASIAAWYRAAALSGNDEITVVRLAGTTHSPTIDGRLEREAITPEYTEALVSWIKHRVTPQVYG
jgi:uncharacterized protein